MNTVTESGLKQNSWILAFDRSGTATEYPQTEIQKDKKAVSDLHPSLILRIIHSAQRCALAVATGNVIINCAG